MFKRALKAFFDHFESYLCQFLLVFFVLVVFMQIVLRQINMSLSWTEEIARYAFIWFILFGACYATRLCALNRVTVQFMKAPQWVPNLFFFAMFQYVQQITTQKGRLYVRQPMCPVQLNCKQIIFNIVLVFAGRDGSMPYSVHGHTACQFALFVRCIFAPYGKSAFAFHE